MLSEPAEPPIAEKPPSEIEPKFKWTPSGIFGELRRRHRVKQLKGVPGIRESILAILKTSCEPFHLLSSPGLAFVSDGLGVLSRVECAAYIYTALCACFLPSSGGLWAQVVL